LIAGVVFLTVFFVLGIVLVWLVHQALLADDEYTRALAPVEETPGSRDGSRQAQPRDRAA
jgi:hypothetical protein